MNELDKIPRKIAPVLHRRLGSFPAVAMVGPRQCGKTTLARSLGGRYYDLEQDPDRLRLDLEWDQVAASSDLVVLDEAQAWPEIFARLRGAIDEDRGWNGRFLLLGSVSPSLMHQVSESLAGRLALVELTPLAFSELRDESQRERRWLFGGYADGGVLRGQGYTVWQLDYLDLLAQRDWQAEKRKASVRAKVEHPFLYVKRHLGYAKVRYRGLAKNTPRIAVRLRFSNLLIAGRYAVA